MRRLLRLTATTLTATVALAGVGTASAAANPHRVEYPFSAQSEVTNPCTGELTTLTATGTWTIQEHLTPSGVYQRVGRVTTTWVTTDGLRGSSHDTATVMLHHGGEHGTQHFTLHFRGRDDQRRTVLHRMQVNLRLTPDGAVFAAEREESRCVGRP